MRFDFTSLRKFTAGISGVLVLSALTACGGSGSDSSDTTNAVPASTTASTSMLSGPSTTDPASATTVPSTSVPKALNPVSAGSRLTADGVAGVTIGATLNAVSAATGQKVTVIGTAGDPPENCSAALAGVDILSIFIQNNDKVLAIAATSGALATDAGIRIGSSVAELKKAYPKATSRVAGEGRVYIAKSSSGKNELMFRTRDDVVTTVVAGPLGIDYTDEFCG